MTSLAITWLFQRRVAPLTLSILFFAILAQILSGQSTDSSGLYTDTLVVDIAF